MFNKKASLFVLALAATGLASCGNSGPDLTYWCPNGDNDLMEQLVAEFKGSNADYSKLNIKVSANYGEGDTYAALHKDLDAAADVILMADNNIRDGVKADELAQIDDAAFQKTVSEGAVAATSIDGKMYGYAYRADNSPMPIYSTETFAKEPTSFEEILKTAKEKGQKVYFDLGNGWYNPTLLWSGGGEFAINAKGELETNLKGDVKAKVAKSLEAYKALYNSYKDTWVSSSDNAAIEAGFKDKKVAYAFLWNDLSAIQAGNAKVAVGMWPTIKVDGKDANMDCFASYKAVVCKNGKDSKRVDLAKKFAAFLASKSSQKKRFDALQHGPSNLELLASKDIQAAPFIAAIGRMEEAKRTHGQALSTTGDFWDPMANLGGLITNGKETWGDYADAGKVIDALVKNKGWSVKA